MPSPAKNTSADSVVTQVKKRSAKGNVKATEFEGPKKSRSSFFVFADEIRTAVMAELRKKAEDSGNKFKVSEVASEIAKRWKNVPEAEKEKYNSVAKAEKEKYDAEMTVWKASDNFKNFEKAKSDKLKSKKITDAKNELKSAGQPSKPQNGYFQFTQSMGAEISAKIEKMSDAEKGDRKYVKIRSDLIKEMWEALSQEKKDEWTNKFKSEMVVYNKEMEEFKKSDAYKKYEKDCDKARKAAKPMKKRASAGGSGEPSAKKVKTSSVEEEKQEVEEV